MSNIKPIIKRMRRKLEVMHLDCKSSGDIVYHDVKELLALIDMHRTAVNFIIKVGT
jgi:hypothetical protein